jgi:antitoxin VapB
MGENVKNAEIKRLAGEVADLARETKFQEFMEQNIWPLIPASELGRGITREQEDEILGYGPEGYVGSGSRQFGDYRDPAPGIRPRNADEGNRRCGRPRRHEAPRARWRDLPTS